MASVLVYIDRDGGGPAEASRRALGEARRIATALGATVYAAGAPADAADADAWIASLGTAGADKVLLLSGVPAVPAIWSSHGPALAQAAAEIEPALILFAASADAAELAPRLAARLDAVFVPDAAVGVDDDGELCFDQRAGLGVARRRVPIASADAPLVVTVPQGRSRPTRGDDDAGAVFLPAPDPEPAAIEALDAEPGPAGSAIEGADVLVVAGAGAEGAMPQVAELAAALGAELAVTHTLARRGVHPDRVVDVSATRVAPKLYVACGASGSAAHLGAIAEGTTIVAIDRDPEASIFAVARYGLVGDLATVLPGVTTAAARLRAPGGAA